MDTVEINERTLSTECENLADSIIEEFEGDITDLAALREYAHERAHEDADGHQWVIYTYKAKQVASCAPDTAEDYLQEIYEKPFDGCETFGDVCTRLAYAALYTGIVEALNEKLEHMEESM